MDFRNVRLQSRVQEEREPAPKPQDQQSDIAIIGIGLKLPLAETEDEFLKVMRENTDAVRKLPTGRREDTDRYFRAAGKEPSELVYGEAAFLESIDRFDYSFFKLSPKEASLLDPNQRLFLETAWRAIEDAGLGGRQLAGTRTGVYVGYGSDSEYKRMIDMAEPESASMAMPGNVKPIIASRLSYLLDLRGPSLLVDTTCSSSLVAVHLACQAIRSGECEMAIAGGIQLHLLPVREFEVGIESSTGRTRTFDDAADGTGTGEGVVALMLKPLNRALQDRDSVYAVIKGSAVNQDGSSVGITAPNADAQADVIAEAWKQAGIAPETVGYIETHGTGTKLGDPIELEGIRRAFARYTNRKMFCAVGSIKSSFGHLDNAAGIAGLLKAALSLKHRQLFPTLHVERPNRAIPFVDSPAYINTRLTEWESGDTPLRCGVSSFGISGTNCHVVLEQAPAPSASAVEKGQARRLELLPLSARSAASLLELAHRYADFMDKNLDVPLGDICYTAATGRGHYAYRLAVLADGREELSQTLRSLQLQDLRGPISDSSESNRQADEALARLRRGEISVSDTLQLLSGLYESGGSIRWERLYEGRSASRWNVPATPFEQQRCWLRLPEDNGTSHLYHQLEWREEPIGRSYSKEKVRLRLPIIITGIDHQLVTQTAELLRAAGETDVSIVVPTAVDYSHSSPIKAYADEYCRLLQQDIRSGPRRIILLFSSNKPSLSAGSSPLLGLLRALDSDERKPSVELLLAAAGVYRVDGTETAANPNAAALFAMGKAIQWEMPHIQARTVDYSHSAEDIDGLAAVLASELGADEPYTTAWRGGKRYVERVCERPNLPESSVPFEWRRGGVYLITGGLGGIGLHIAQRIAAQGAVRLALLNRSAFPSRDAWEEIVTADAESKEARQIRAIRDIEHNGSHVEFVRADCADERSLREALEHIHHRLGRVNGVVHAAGSGDGNYLTQLTDQQIEQFTSAKITGTRLLDELTRTDEPDFFVLFSSAITLVGGVGSGPYAAANSWLDSYAAARRAEGSRMISIGWPAWDRTGLSAASEPDERKELFHILQPDRGADSFERLLQSDASHILVGEWNRNSVLFELGSRLPFRTDIPFAASSIQPSSKAVNTIRAATAKLRGKSNGESYSQVEQMVAQAWMAVLGYEEFGVDDNFFELGGDSILIARLHARLLEHFPDRVTIANLFSYPTIAKLSAFLQPEDDENRIEDGGGTEAARSNRNAEERSDIAIIGMTVHLPDAPDLDTFWANLIGGKESIRAYPEARQEDARRFVAHYTDVPHKDVRFSQGGYLERVDEFDPDFFGISPREASLMDPNQRLFLEACWEAIEDAGYGGGKIRSTRTGVYLGYADWPLYGQYITKKFPSLIHAAGAGNTPSLIASRIAYMLDLQGPAFLVDTACSSSLVAVHLACRAIRSGECEMAIAGGVKACLMPVEGVFEIGIESSHRQTRAFDDSSDGTVWGEGTVALLLKPLDQAQADGDRIYAVIKGSAINQDGASAGITAPNAVAQHKVMVQAWEDAAIDPSTVSYIETHGTGTKLGDPIEVDGIQQAFERYTDKKQFCAISSVKSNIGHLDSAAGVAGLAKAVASLQNRKLAPTLHFDRPNRNIAFDRSPVYVVDRPQAWGTDGHPRRCGVSSFGFSGTNCHVVLEEAPPSEYVSRSTDEAEQWRILALSGRTAGALRTLTDQYRSFLRTSSDSLDDICATANTGRGHYAFRLALVFRNRRELEHQLDRLTEYEMECPSGIYQGSHRVVNGEREATAIGVLTAAEQRKLGAEAELQLDELQLLRSDHNLSGHFEGHLRELARLYVAGAGIDWERLYAGTKNRKVRVPIYPFQRSRYWLMHEPESRTQSEPISNVAAGDTEADGQPMVQLPVVNVTIHGLSSAADPTLERRIGQLWGNLLGVHELHAEDDFFELGGHSMLAIELETKLALGGINIDSSDLYQHSTIAALARHIRATHPYELTVEREYPQEGVVEATPTGGDPSSEPPDVIEQPYTGTNKTSAAANTAQAVRTPEAKVHTLEPLAGLRLAETLILPGIEPFNDIFYRNCFFNSMFPAIRSFGCSIAPFLANDLVVYTEADSDYAVNYVPFRPMEEVFPLAGVQTEPRCGSSDIVSELLDSISAGQPVVVWVDCYDLPIRQDAYGKRHIDHTLLVFGFDRRERLFHIVEHDRMENLSYRRRTLPFEQLACAFNGFVERYVRTGEHEVTHYTFAPSTLPSGPDCDPVVQWARCWHEGQVALAGSLATLERFRSEYISSTEVADLLKVKADPLVEFLNSAAITKRVEQYRLETLLPEAVEEGALLSEIVADWEFVRKGVARYVYGGGYRLETFEAGAERIAHIARQEQKLHRMIAARLDAIAERIY